MNDLRRQLEMLTETLRAIEASVSGPEEGSSVSERSLNDLASDARSHVQSVLAAGKARDSAFAEVRSACDDLNQCLGLSECEPVDSIKRKRRSDWRLKMLN